LELAFERPNNTSATWPMQLDLLKEVTACQEAKAWQEDKV